MKVVEHKPGWHRHEGFQSEQRFRAVCHQGYWSIGLDMQPADESGQSTLQTRNGLVNTSKHPYFPVYFAHAGENLKIPARSLSYPPSNARVTLRGADRTRRQSANGSQR